MLLPVSSHVPWFSPICARLNFSLPSFQRPFLTIRQNSLYVTVCIIARPSCRGYFIHSLSTLYYYNAPSLATRLTGDYRDRTYTGKCGPASLDTPHKKDMQSFDSPHAFLLFLFILIYFPTAPHQVLSQPARILLSYRFVKSALLLLQIILSYFSLH